MTGDEITAFAHRFVYGEDGTGINAAGEAFVRAIQGANDRDGAQVLVRFAGRIKHRSEVLVDHVLDVDAPVAQSFASLEKMVQGVLITRDPGHRLSVSFAPVGKAHTERFSRRIPKRARSKGD